MINDKELKYIEAVQMMIDSNMSSREVAKKMNLKYCTILRFIHRENGLKSISSEIYKMAIKQLSTNKTEAKFHRKKYKERILKDRYELVEYLENLGYDCAISDKNIDIIILHIDKMRSVIFSLKVKNKVIITFEDKENLYFESEELIYSRKDFMSVMKVFLLFYSIMKQ